MVLTRISVAGQELLKELDAPVDALHRTQLDRLTDDQLRSLIDLLTLVREGGVG
jgi:hypothetical protein